MPRELMISKEVPFLRCELRRRDRSWSHRCRGYDHLRLRRWRWAWLGRGRRLGVKQLLDPRGEVFGIGGAFVRVIVDARLQQVDQSRCHAAVLHLLAPAAAAGAFCRQVASQELVPHDAQGVDVVARVGPVAPALLRRGVQGRVSPPHGTRQRLLARQRPAGLLADHLRRRDAADAEVGHQQRHLAIGFALDEDVGRLQVAVDDGRAQAVGEGDCLRQAQDDLGGELR